MPGSSFWTELRRRNVFRVAALYLVAAWLALQVADIILPALALPDWSLRLVLALLAFGFPFAVLFAWLFELTPEGLKRESDVDPERSITPLTGRRIDFLIIGVLAVAVALLLYDKLAASKRTEPVVQLAAQSVAVLPFINMGGDDESRAFSDGLAETLLHRLAQIDDLQVAARTSSFQFRDYTGDIAEIGRALNVANLLEGSVQRAGDTIRVTAQLIDVSNGFHRWSRVYDRKLADVFAIQDDIAREVVTELRGTLSVPEELREKDGTADFEAYEAFLRGRQQQLQFSHESLPRAVALLERAVILDPDFVRARLALANTYLDMEETGVMPPERAVALASEQLQIAFDKAGETVDTMTTLGRLEVARVWLEPDAEARAEKALLRALDIDADNPVALANYSEYLLHVAIRPADAAQFARRGLRLDPRSDRLLRTLATSLSRLDRDDEALAQYALLREYHPESPAGYYLPAHVSSRTGDFVSAIGWMLAAFEKDPQDHEMPAEVARYMLHLGDPQAALQWAERSLQIEPDAAAGRAALLDAYAVLGDRTRGMALAAEVLRAERNRRYGLEWVALWWLLAEGVETGDFDPFFAEMRQRYPGLDADPPVVNAFNSGYGPLLLQGLTLSGDADKARILGERLLELFAREARQSPAANLSDEIIVHAALGRHDEALAALDRWYEQGNLGHWWSLQIEPVLEPLRERARFRAVMTSARHEMYRQREEVRSRHGI